MTQMLLVMVLAAPASREVVFARLQQEPERDAIEKTTALPRQIRGCGSARSRLPPGSCSVASSAP